MPAPRKRLPPPTPATLPTDRAAYERLPEETDEEWLAFSRYLAAEPRARSVVVLERQLVADKIYLSSAKLYAWSRQFRWVERAESWDAIQRAEREARLRAQAEVEAEKIMEVASLQLSTAKDFFAEVAARLANGDFKKADLKTLSRFLQGMAKLADSGGNAVRLAQDKPTTMVGVQGGLVLVGRHQFALDQVAGDELSATQAYLAKLLSRGASEEAPSIEGEYREVEPGESPDPESQG